MKQSVTVHQSTQNYEFFYEIEQSRISVKYVIFLAKISHLPNVSVQCFSSKGKLATSVLHATVIRAGGVQDIVPSLLMLIKRSLFFK
jgi:hypothetical protein